MLITIVCHRGGLKIARLLAVSYNFWSVKLFPESYTNTLVRLLDKTIIMGLYLLFRPSTQYFLIRGLCHSQSALNSIELILTMHASYQNSYLLFKNSQQIGSVVGL